MDQNDHIVKVTFRKYFLFSVLSTIAVPIGMTIDGFVIGNFLGTYAMASVGLVSPILILLSAFASLISSGGLSLSGQYIGREQPEKAKRIFSVTMLCAFAVYMVILVLCVGAPETLGRLLGANDATLPLTAAYIRGIGWGSGLAIPHRALIEFTKLDGSPALGPISIAVMSLVNVGCDLASVFVFKSGIYGIGLATSLSYLAAFLVCCFHFFKKSNTLRLTKIHSLLKEIFSIFKTGMPAATNWIFSAIAVTFINFRLMSLWGNDALASFALQGTIMQFFDATVMGITSATLMLASIFYGEEDRKTLCDLLKLSIREGLMVISILGAVAFGLSNEIASLFVRNNAAVEAMVSVAVRWKILAMIVFAVNSIFAHYYQSSEKLKIANLTSFLGALPFQCLFVFILPLFMGINGIWASNLFSMLTLLLFIVCMVTYKNKRFPRKTEDFLLLPHSFGALENARLDIMITNNLNTICQISERVWLFCRERKIDEKRSHHLALCVEEMASNVAKYGFTDINTHFIDIRILIKDNELIFRLRNNGSPFNPLDLTSIQDYDPYKNIGITLTRGLSISSDYRYTAGLNNLIVRL